MPKMKPYSYLRPSTCSHKAICLLGTSECPPPADAYELAKNKSLFDIYGCIWLRPQWTAPFSCRCHIRRIMYGRQRARITEVKDERDM